MNPFRKKAVMPEPSAVLPGRAPPLPVPERHAVNGNRIVPPFPEGTKLALFGLGCFWGAERKFWQVPGVYSTSVGYAAGSTPNPTYEEVCSGYTGHNEVVRVAYDPRKVSDFSMSMFSDLYTRARVAELAIMPGAAGKNVTANDVPNGLEGRHSLA